MIGPVLALALVVVAEHPHATYVRPVPGAIVRRFEQPSSPYGPGHRGLDFACARGETVVASASGTVTFAGAVAGSLYVTIAHDDGLRTTYSYVSRVLVSRGRVVARREPIARCGDGHPGSADAHLHFGLRRGEEYLDPEPYLLASVRRDYAGLIRLAAG